MTTIVVALKAIIALGSWGNKKKFRALGRVFALDGTITMESPTSKVPSNSIGSKACAAPKSTSMLTSSLYSSIQCVLDIVVDSIGCHVVIEWRHNFLESLQPFSIKLFIFQMIIKRLPNYVCNLILI
jgi:hypothetical protein